MSFSLARRQTPMVLAGTFQATMWVLSVVATLFVISRFAVRVSVKGRLVMKDYPLVLAAPVLFIALGLLQTILPTALQIEDQFRGTDTTHPIDFSTSRLTATIEMLWIVIYCVKFCFLAQFKLYRPPYAYVNVNLTRCYWVMMVICFVAFVVTIAVPAILCPNQGNCRYIEQSGNVPWEITVSVLDIITDSLVISLPIFLIRLSNSPPLHSFIDGVFKTLSIFTVVVAAIRIALQYDRQTHRINYANTIYLLIIEANVALVMASITSYRTLVLDYLKKTGRINKMRLSGLEPDRTWHMTRLHGSSRTTQDNHEGSPADTPNLLPTTPLHSPPR